MDIKARDKQLSQFFDKDIMAELDEAQKTVLYEEFANSELRVLASQGVETIKAQASLRTNAEIERRMTHIRAEEYPLLKEWYLSISKTVHEIICSKCGALLGIEIDTIDDNMNPHHLEGKFVIPVGENMYAYRPRLDGIMGYQCANTVKSETFDDWEKFKIDMEKFHERAKEAQEDYNAKVEAYNKLSEEEQADAQVPVNDFTELPPTPPEIPPMVPCGNDTRWAQIEIDNIPEEHIMTSLTKDDIVKVKQDMNVQNYEPDTHKTKKGYTAEGFELREVKA